MGADGQQRKEWWLPDGKDSGSEAKPGRLKQDSGPPDPNLGCILLRLPNKRVDGSVVHSEEQHCKGINSLGGVEDRHHQGAPRMSWVIDMARTVNSSNRN